MGACRQAALRSRVVNDRGITQVSNINRGQQAMRALLLKTRSADLSGIQNPDAL